LTACKAATAKLSDETLQELKNKLAETQATKEMLKTAEHKKQRTHFIAAVHKIYGTMLTSVELDFTASVALRILQELQAPSWLVDADFAGKPVASYGGPAKTEKLLQVAYQLEAQMETVRETIDVMKKENV